MATRAEALLGEAAHPVSGREYTQVRTTTLDLCQHLAPEDCVVQSMPDASPAKWHLAHTTWFFEHFILAAYKPGYRRFDDAFHHLFNSYYQSAGKMHPRPQRGLISRPLLQDIHNYRDYVDQAIRELLTKRPDDPAISQLLTLGLNHEQQHQELLLTDIKHVFSCNPMKHAVNPELTQPPARDVSELRFEERPGGIFEIGADGEGFCFDNETPRHRVLVPAHRMGSRLVTNEEYLGFIREGGYEKPELWLSDGWAVIGERGWNRPMYWDKDLASEFTLGGQRDINPHAPVTHVSYYEADAFARWMGARLPTEAEWELSAADRPVSGNLLESQWWHPAPAIDTAGQFFGDTWEWTSSPYAAYPGFKPLAGSLGEYNGKFMCNQMTVRGGSCVTAERHVRASYRSFFYPDARWQFLGIRLATDGETTP